jgi:hypothetical protein
MDPTGGDGDAALPLWRQLGLASFRFGLSFHWQPINNVILQVQVVQLLGRQNQGRGVGLPFGLGTVFAALVPPLVGTPSDRISTPFGRRRPLMAIAVALDLAGLAIMLTALSYPQLIAGYVVAQLASNGAGAAYSGLIPDSVPAPTALGRPATWASSMPPRCCQACSCPRPAVSCSAASWVARYDPSDRRLRRSARPAATPSRFQMLAARPGPAAPPPCSRRDTADSRMRLIRRW